MSKNNEMNENNEINNVENQINQEPNTENSSDQKLPINLKRKRYVISLIVFVVLAIIGLWYYNYITTYISTDDAYVEGNIISICPKVDGNIVKLYVDDNQKVKEGDLLVEIDPRDYQVKYDLAKARLLGAIERHKSSIVNESLVSITSGANLGEASSAVATSTAQIKVADKQITQTKHEAAQIHNLIASIKAEYELAQIELDRNQNLFNKGAVPKEDYDKASTRFKTAEANLYAGLEKIKTADAAVRSAYANKEVAVQALGQVKQKRKSANTIPEQVTISNLQSRMASAEIKQLQAALRQAELELSYTKVYAPQSGSITNKMIEVGSYVQKGQPLFTIVPKKVWVVANYKETQLTDIKKGQKVKIKIDTYPGKEFSGRVDSIQHSSGAKSSLFPPENAVGSFVKVVQRIPVKITFVGDPELKYTIVPGMSVIPEVKVK